MRYLARVLIDSGMSDEVRELIQRQSLPVWLWGSIGWSGGNEVMLNLLKRIPFRYC